jgi:hypothetical protein
MDRTITGIGTVDGIEEPIVMRLTEAEVEDDTKAPIWIVEVWKKDNAREKYAVAADFKKHGVIVPVGLEKAMEIARHRQNDFPGREGEYVYRIRNIHTNAVLMAAVLSR